MRIINDSKLDCETENTIRKVVEEINNIEELQPLIEYIRGIKVVDEHILHEDVSSRIEDGYILIPIDKIWNSLNNNEEINALKSNIIHEIYHVKYQNILAKIHELYNEAYKKEDYVVVYTIIIYIEYLVHLESTKYESKEMIKRYFKSINNYKWDFSKELSCVYLVKHAGYIIARAEDKRVKDERLILHLKNPILRVEMKNLQKILDDIEIKDDYKILLPIEKIVRKYIIDV